jgi:ComF family protein
VAGTDFLFSLFDEWLRAWLELALPPACAACEAPVSGRAALCPACDAALPRLRAELAPASPLSACVAAVEFCGAAEAWIHRFKYPAPGLAGLDPGALAVASAWIAEAAARAPDPPDLVVPVPLHPRRLRQRGFNPAGLLARAAARAGGARLDATALYRLRDTPSQTSLDRRQRRANVRGAFAARRPVPARVWLVDDVVTTGATLAEAARALRRAGARRVIAVCAAATPRS